MSGPTKIDTHLHLYPSHEEGAWFKGGYDIWENGQLDGVQFRADTGTLDETVAALGRGGLGSGVGASPSSGGPVPGRGRAPLSPAGGAAQRALAAGGSAAAAGGLDVAVSE